MTVLVSFSGRPAVAVYASVTDLIGNTPIVDISSLSPNPNVRILAKLEAHSRLEAVAEARRRKLLP